MQIQIKVDGLNRLDELPAQVKKGLIQGFRKAVLFAESISKKSFGKADSLNVRTGHLRRSIESRIKERFGSYVGEIGTDVIYGRVHELSSIIKAKNPTGYMTFKIGDRWIKTKEVFIPQRSFLEEPISDRPTVEKMRELILEDIIKEGNKP